MAHAANTIIQQHGDFKTIAGVWRRECNFEIWNGGAWKCDIFDENSQIGGKGRVLKVKSRTDLLEALAKEDLTSKGTVGSIEWICNHSRNTQPALLRGYVDIALTYEREQKEIAVSEGLAESVRGIFQK